jgi:cobalt/nickel transport system permease protein
VIEMHMADALISPDVGGCMWLATAGIAIYSIKKVQNLEDHKIPLMGVMGAFIFAAQMINFSIPGTGSSGHLGGGLLLAILLGPYAGFLTMTSVLVIQALCFADGGLLALGCNIFNLGFYPCYIVYPLIYRLIAGNNASNRRIIAGTLVAAVAGLQLGAFSVAVETFFSGRTELPFLTFIMLLQPIHLAIGVVEGLVTASIVVFIRNARPEIIENSGINGPSGRMPAKVMLEILAIVTILIAGFLSWFASTHPDGLEWSIAKVSGKEQIESSGSVHKTFEHLQNKTALLPDYRLPDTNKIPDGKSEQVWPAVDGGTSLAGLTGGILTMILAGVTGLTIMYVKKRKKLSLRQNKTIAGTP